ncbi:hypothetical protein E4T47_04678 [Aureobasidium subglaciale]|nr:hypothetical protein E4T47_04678 [Aureobasidium subglaciale]
MTTLKDFLERLDLSRYHDALVEEGFDTWETLMDITESDLEALGVKLGHRRVRFCVTTDVIREYLLTMGRQKLQRAILNASKDRTPLPLLLHSALRDDSVANDEARKKQDSQIPQLQQQRSQDSTTQETSTISASNGQPTRSKRKYRRHPKVGRASAHDDGGEQKLKLCVYRQMNMHRNDRRRHTSSSRITRVEVRDELKGKDLSFTEIAKLVGERWQELQAHEKEPCEREAQALKDTYYSELRTYKKTPQYKAYQEYLIEFRAKHSESNAQGDAKKPKTRPSSGQSRSYDDSHMDGDEGVDGVECVDMVDGIDGADGENNQVQPSPTHSSPNTQTFRQFPPPRPTSSGDTVSSYSTWRSTQQADPSTAVPHRNPSISTFTTYTTSQDDDGSTSPRSSRPPLSSAHTSAPQQHQIHQQRPATKSPLPPHQQPSANTLPPLSHLDAHAPRKSSTTPLMNWPLHTTLPPIVPSGPNNHHNSTPSSMYSSPTLRHVTNPPPVMHPMQNGDAGAERNKASLSTLLRASEHVDARDAVDARRASGRRVS